MIFAHPPTQKFFLVFVLVMLAIFTFGILPAKVNNTAAIPPFSQDWKNTGIDYYK